MQYITVGLQDLADVIYLGNFDFFFLHLDMCTAFHSITELAKENYTPTEKEILGTWNMEPTWKI